MFISRLFRDHDEVPIGFHVGKQATRIDQKIYNKAKSVLTYFSPNKTLLSIGICYLSINLAQAISINISPITHLEGCTTTICHLWNKKFPPSLDFRCNASNPNYYPFTIFEKCMQTLCQMLDTEAKFLFGCYKYTGQLMVSLELSKNSTVLANLWNQYCPKGLYNVLTTEKKQNFYYDCFKELCAYYKKFPSLKDNLLERACFSLRINELEDAVNEFEKKIEVRSPKDYATLSMLESGTNIANNFIAVGSIIVSVYLSGKIAYKAKKALMPTLSGGLASIIKGTAGASMAVANIELYDPGIRGNVAEAVSDLSEYVDEIFSDARSHLSGESDSIQESDSIYQSASSSLSEISSKRLSLVSQLQPTLLGFGAGTLVGGGALKALEMLGVDIKAISDNSASSPVPYEENKNGITSIEKFVTSMTSNLTYLMKDTLDRTENLDEGSHSSVTFIKQIVTKSPWDIMSTLKPTLYEKLSQIKYTNDHFQTTAEEYNDFLLDTAYYNNRLHTEAARIEHSLEYWNNSICIYEEPRHLYCRSNFYNYIINLPVMAVRTLIASNKYLCTYVEQLGLWCDWNQFLDLAASKFFSTRNITVTNECPSDFVFLNMEKYEDMGTKLNMTGDCYRENFTLPWE